MKVIKMKNKKQEIPNHSHPLQYPSGWERTPESERESSRFEVRRGRAIRHLFKNLRLLGADNYKISTDIPTYTQGEKEIPYADAKVEDPGVAIYFEYNGTTHAMACDKWDDVRSNIRALGKTVEALRGIEIWGSSEMMQTAFKGYERLPSPETYEDKDLKELKELLKETHPDQGGDSEEFKKVKKAYERLRDKA